MFQPKSQFTTTVTIRIARTPVNSEVVELHGYLELGPVPFVSRQLPYRRHSILLEQTCQRLHYERCALPSNGLGVIRLVTLDQILRGPIEDGQDAE